MDELAAVEAFKQRALARTAYLATPQPVRPASLYAPPPPAPLTAGRAPAPPTPDRHGAFNAGSEYDKLRALQAELSSQALRLQVQGRPTPSKPPAPSHPPSAPASPFQPTPDPRDRSLADLFTRKAMQAQLEAQEAAAAAILAAARTPPGPEGSGLEAQPSSSAAARALAFPHRSRTPSTAGSALSSRSRTPSTRPSPSPGDVRGLSASGASLAPRHPPSALPVLPEDVARLRGQITAMERQIAELTALSQMTPPGAGGAAGAREVEGLRTELQEVIRVIADVIAGSSATLEGAGTSATSKPSSSAAKPKGGLSGSEKRQPPQPPQPKDDLVAHLVEILSTHKESAAHNPSMLSAPLAPDHEWPFAEPPSPTRGPPPLPSASQLTRRLFDEEGQAQAWVKNPMTMTQDSSVQCAAEGGAGETSAEREVKELRAKFAEAERHVRFLVNEVEAGEARLAAERAAAASLAERLEAVQRELAAQGAEVEALREENAYYRSETSSTTEVYARELGAARERIAELEEKAGRLEEQTRRQGAALRAVLAAERDLRDLRESTDRVVSGRESIWEAALRVPTSSPGPAGMAAGASPLGASPGPGGRESDAALALDVEAEACGARLAAEVRRLQALMVKAQVEGVTGGLMGVGDGGCGVQ